MKTNQIMLRQMDGYKVAQRTKDGYYFANDLIKAYNEKHGTKKLVANYLKSDSTKETIDAIEEDIPNGISALQVQKGGKNQGTWMHPYLFIDFAMWLSPTFKVQVLKWIHDNLITFRNEAGDHYKDMCKAYVIATGDTDPKSFSREAHMINYLVFGKPVSGQRNVATERQLDKLNKLQQANIKLLLGGLQYSERYQQLTQFSKLYA